nr:RHS repeat-associated core domain-containing protein [Cyanobacterium aponinum]
MRYLHGNQVDQVLAQENGDGNVVWLLRDYLGTIRDFVDNTGNVVNHLTYDSYGNVVSETDATVDSRYRFTGREWDEEIELYYYRARYYSGQTGRFISVDPISFESGTYNLYGYVDNNPVSNSDPFGYFKVELRYRKAFPSFTARLMTTLFPMMPNFFGSQTNVTSPTQHHADIVVSDKNGFRSYWAKASIGIPGNFGYITTDQETDVGDYAPGFDFYVGDPARIQQVYFDNSDCPNRSLENEIINEFSNIRQKNIPYDPLSANSNSAAFSVIEKVFGKRPTPKVPAPAWNVNLFNF